MSPLAFLRQLLDAGMDQVTAWRMAEQFDAERRAEAQAERDALIAKLLTVKDEAAERRRAKDRERKKDGKARNSADSAEFHGIPRNSAETGDPEPPRARIDNNPPTEGIPNLTTLDGADALVWPSEPPTKDELDRLEAAIRAAAGPALASEAVAPRLAVLGPILGLAKPGQGPPCDLHADVLPVIRARSAKARPGSVRSWDFYREAIIEARDRRLTGTPEPRNDRPDRPQPNARAARRAVWAEVLAEETSAGTRPGG